MLWDILVIYLCIVAGAAVLYGFIIVIGSLDHWLYVHGPAWYFEERPVDNLTASIAYEREKARGL